MFRASGAITLGIDGKAQSPGPLERTVSTATPGSPDDFYYVFNVARIKGSAPRKADPSALSVRMDVPAGTLMVSGDARFEWTFEDANGTPHGNDRSLASQIVLHPAMVPTKTVELSWGNVTAVFDASKPLTITMRAACACGSDRLSQGEAAPGFFEVYELYPGGVPYEDRLIPRFKGGGGLPTAERADATKMAGDAVVLTPGTRLPANGAPEVAGAARQGAPGRRVISEGHVSLREQHAGPAASDARPAAPTCGVATFRPE